MEKRGWYGESGKALDNTKSQIHEIFMFLSLLTGLETMNVMKTPLLVLFFFFSVVNLTAQTTSGTDPKIPVIERKGAAQHPKPAAVNEGPRQRGISISSAARRGTLQNSAGSKEQSLDGNNQRDAQNRTITNQPQRTRIERPNPARRPQVRVPAARRPVPVVRPNRPIPRRPIRPIRPPGGGI